MNQDQIDNNTKPNGALVHSNGSMIEPATTYITSSLCQRITTFPGNQLPKVHTFPIIGVNNFIRRVDRKNVIYTVKVYIKSKKQLLDILLKSKEC